MTPLSKWTLDVLNHQANNAKIPLEKVVLSHDAWKAAKTEMTEWRTQLEKEYEEKHKLPRMTQEASYEQFANQQRELMEKWKSDKSKSSLNQIIKLKREKYTEDPVYTMYYYQYNW